MEKYMVDGEELYNFEAYDEKAGIGKIKCIKIAIMSGKIISLDSEFVPSDYFLRYAGVGVGTGLGTFKGDDRSYIENNHEEECYFAIDYFQKNNPKELTNLVSVLVDGKMKDYCLSKMA